MSEMQLCTPVKRQPAAATRHSPDSHALSMQLPGSPQPFNAPMTLTPTKLRQPPLRVAQRASSTPPSSKSPPSVRRDSPPKPVWNFDTKLPPPKIASLRAPRASIEASGGQRSPSTPRPSGAGNFFAVNQMRGHESNKGKATFGCFSEKTTVHESAADASSAAEVHRQLEDERKLVMKLVDDLELTRARNQDLERQLSIMRLELQRSRTDANDQRAKFEMALDMMPEMQRLATDSAISQAFPSASKEKDLASAICGLSLGAPLSELGAGDKVISSVALAAEGAIL